MEKHENELRIMRDRELIYAYKKILKDEYARGCKIDRKRVIKRVIEESKPHFHVSFEHAFKVLSSVRNHGTGNFKCTLRQQKWNELMSLVNQEMQDKPYLNLSTALSRVLAFKRASRFYISPEYCYKYIYKFA